MRILSDRSVKIHTLARYYYGPPSRPGLVFGYGVVDLPEITRGLTTLRSLLSP
jgi:GntR family transcriptional regulator/MocR family aminotransferase